MKKTQHDGPHEGSLAEPERPVLERLRGLGEELIKQDSGWITVGPTLLADAIAEIEGMDEGLNRLTVAVLGCQAQLRQYTEAKVVRWEYKSHSGWHEVGEAMAKQQHSHYGTEIRALIEQPKGETEE